MFYEVAKERLVYFNTITKADGTKVELDKLDDAALKAAGFAKVVERLCLKWLKMSD